MLPIILKKRQKVLIVGAGRACEIKLKVLSRIECDITIVADQFLCELPSDCTKINKTFDQLDYDFFQPFDLIYIAIKLDDTTMVEKLYQTKMINVLSNPALSNFIHPCTRDDNDIMVSVNSVGKPNPKRACGYANRFMEYKPTIKDL